jgi:hypothetical protein
MSDRFYFRDVPTVRVCFLSDSSFAPPISPQLTELLKSPSCTLAEVLDDESCARAASGAVEALLQLYFSFLTPAFSTT